MKKIPFIQAMSMFVLMAIAIGVIGGNLNPDNLPAPSMRTLDELYKNIQPGLPSDWKPYPLESQTTGAGAIHLRIEGVFPIEGSCQAPYKDDTIVVIGLGHEINIPYNAGSGLPSSGPAHEPFVISKYIDKASPRLYQAMTEGRSMRLTFKFYRTDNAHSQEEWYYTVFLDNARVVNMRMAHPNIEQVSFVYETIRWTYEPGNIEWEDDWTL
jgi:type VI secretion system secreted protein Hcp